MGWPLVVAFIIALAIAVKSIPKPQTQPPAGLNEIQAPTAEDGREIPVLFGTRDMSGPNIVYYGDLRTTPVKK